MWTKNTIKNRAYAFHIAHFLKKKRKEKKEKNQKAFHIAFLPNVRQQFFFFLPNNLRIAYTTCTRTNKKLIRA